jgi:hypothetical protein
LEGGVASLNFCKVRSTVGEGREIDRWIEEPNGGLFTKVAVVRIVERVRNEVSELQMKIKKERR